MPLLCAPAYRALAAIAIALLSGCTSATAGLHGSPLIALREHSLNAQQLLEMQAAGELPGPVPLAGLRYQLDRPLFHRSSTVSPKGLGRVALWVSNTDSDYILGQTKSGESTVAVIKTLKDGCDSPVALKVDHVRNLWVACEDSPAYAAGVVQEYAGSKPVATYPQGCGTLAGCTWLGSYGFDSATDSSGHVFAAIASFSYSVGSQTTSGSGFEWWSSPSSVPTLLALPQDDPVTSVYYMDVDGAGNIWFDYLGCQGSNCGYGLAEITHPTSASWQFVSILPAGSLGFAGGVYVSNGGKTLNVTDQNARTVSQYALPLSPSAAPSRVLGPTKKNVLGFGNPVSGGFDQLEKTLAQADLYGWLDTGTVARNAWTDAGNADDYGGIQGAAYTPSDK